MPLTQVSRAEVIANEMTVLSQQIAKLAQELKEIEAEGKGPVPRTTTMRPKSEFRRFKGKR